MARVMGATLGLLAALIAAGAARAAPPLGLTDCRAVEGTRQCAGPVASWDGVPLDTTVTLPATGGSRLPLVVETHGFGNSKQEYLTPAETAYTDNVYAWARDGYAVLTFTARGLWGSCGTPEARLASPAACAKGYLRLADTRYEVRDTQELIGRLVDEGVADPLRIGATGDSYGGGQSFALAALRDRVMLPDGRLIPWRSPAGTPLRLAAAAPVIPWTSLIGAIAPNGLTAATALTPPGLESRPVGVFKASVANAILAAAQLATGPGQAAGQPYVPGRPEGYVAPAGTDPEADVAGWVARADQGEPYTDAQARAIVERLERFHSAYGIDQASAPPPLFVGAGFTDDLFPVDETLRFVERMRRTHPRVPVSLYLGDFGHQRAANKPADRARLLAYIHTWFDHYVRGDGPVPPTGVVATTQTCPRAAPSEGPFAGPDLAALAPGTASLSTDRPQTLSTGGGDPGVGRAIDPVAGGGDGCVQTGAADAPGTAVYRFAPAPAGGTTLLGAPRVSARLAVTGADPTVTQVASRLWDVAPDGRTQTLVARALYRPSGGASDAWELHANAWRFAPGHVAKLELLAADAPYGRPSNATFSTVVRSLDVRLPVREGAAARSCVSRRVVRLRVRLRRARVTVGGRRVALRRGRAVIDLRGRPRQTVRVRISGRTSAGRRVVQFRRYRTCTRRGAA